MLILKSKEKILIPPLDSRELMPPLNREVRSWNHLDQNLKNNDHTPCLRKLFGNFRSKYYLTLILSNGYLLLVLLLLLQHVSR